MTSSRKVIAGPANERREDAVQLAELAKAGVLRPVIDRALSLRADGGSVCLHRNGTQEGQRGRERPGTRA
jgi:hypothetical protein